MVIQNNQDSSAFFDPHQSLSPSSCIASPRNNNNRILVIQNNQGSATFFDEDDEEKSVGVTMTPRSLRLRGTTTNKKKQLPAPVIIIISFVSLICFNEFYHSIHYTSSTLLMFQTAMKSAESEPTARARSTAAAITVITSENNVRSINNNNNTSPSSSSESSSSTNYNSSRNRNNNIVVISKEYNDRHCWLEPAWGEMFMAKKKNPAQQVPSSLINLVQKDPEVLDYFQSIRKQLGKKDKKNEDDFCVGDDGSTKPSSFADELVLSTSNTMGKTTVAPDTAATYLTCNNDNDDDKPTIIPQTNDHISSSSSSQILDEGLTVALLYYAQPSMLLRQLEAFGNYTESIRDKLTILVVDDGSPKGLRASEYIHLFNNNNNNNVTNNNRGLLRIRMARITKDKDWNIGGARNLAFYLTDTSKVLLLDIDIIVPSKAMKRALSWPTTNSNHNIAHRFNRKFKDGSKKIHPAVCVISREAYWENGGCDEDFVGHYGYTDVHFWYRWDFTNKMNKKKSDSFSASGGEGSNTTATATTTTTIVEKNKKKKKINLRIDHDDTHLEQIKKNACDKTYMSNFTDFTKCVMAQGKLKLPNKGGNKNKALYNKKTKSGCWSNKFLRFPWVLEH